MLLFWILAISLGLWVLVSKPRAPFEATLVAENNVAFEFGKSVAANQFWERNPTFWPAFERLLTVSNKTFGREWRPTNRMEDIGFNLGETC